MKKTLQQFFLLGLFALSNNLIAQPTLTASGTAPIVGYTTFTIMNEGFLEGPSGANQTWNFTSIGNISANADEYVTVASTPYASQFPNANLASSSFSYFNSNITAFTLVGKVSPGGVVYNYSNGEDIMRFPFTYNDTYTDQWAVNFTSGIDFFRTASTTVTADGYGTVITQNGTYDNALRFHFVQTYHDSSSAFELDYVNEQYLWYKEGIKEPLAFTSVFTTLGGNPSTSGGYATVTVGVEETTISSAALNLFPNPATASISLSLNDEYIGNAKIIILNQLGQQVSAVESCNLMAANAMQIDVAHLRNGFYTLQIISDENAIINKRFSINK